MMTMNDRDALVNHDKDRLLIIMPISGTENTVLAPRSTFQRSTRIRRKRSRISPFLCLFVFFFFARLSPTFAWFSPTTTFSSTSCSLHGASISSSLRNTFSRPSSPRTSSSSSCSFLMMGKGDGKKKRPKKNKQAPATSVSPAPAPSLPRVSNDINIPIRRQIAFGKLNKQYRESLSGSSFRQSNRKSGGGGGGPANKPLKRTKYRKQLDEETIQQKALERQRKGQDPDWDVILNQTAADPLVFVDGYNIIHKWPRLKKHMTKGDTEKARRLLLEDLEGLASLKRWRVECVFDGGANVAKQNHAGGGALGGNGKGANFQGATSTLTSNGPSDTAPSKEVYDSRNTVRVVFTGRGVEADSYIEGRCADAKNVTLGKPTSSLMVATDDGMIKMAALNAGALCMSADRFVSELKAVKKSMSYRVEAAMAAVNGHAIRPESMWGTDLFFTAGYESDAPKKEILEEREDGTKMYIQRVGRGEFLIEDKREKNRRKQELKKQKYEASRKSNSGGDNDNNTSQSS